MPILQKTKKFIIAHKIWSAVIILAVVFVGYRIFHKSASLESRYVLTTVAKGNIVSSVDASGQISAENQIELKPKNGGVLTGVRVKAGQNVSRGQTLFTIDAGDAEKGVRDASLDLKIAEEDLANAKVDYATTKRTQEKSLHDLLLSINSDVVAIPDEGNTHADIIDISGSYDSLEQGRYTISTYSCANGICASYKGLESDTFPINENIPVPLGTRGLFVTFTDIPSAHEEWVIDIPSPASKSYASNLRAYDDKKQSVADAIEGAERKVNDSQINLIEKQNALIDAKDKLSDYYVTAPFPGQVATVDAKLGDTVSGGSVLATFITPQKIAEISMNEVDVAKIKLNEKAELTFDAVPELKINGEVSEIDSLGTAVQGVVTYKVKITLDTNDERVKAGMSVDATIVTDSKNDTIVVPSSAVKTLNGKNFVEVLDNSTAPVEGTIGVTALSPVRRIPVEVGISNDNQTEIISGVEEGQKVVARTIVGTAAPKAPAAPSLFGGSSPSSRNGGSVRFGSGAAK
jgi:RND family efflux transporter MFP subunit